MKLDKFPVEILELILSKRLLMHNPLNEDRFDELRLVSKAFNRVVEPLAFSKVFIQIEPQPSDTTLRQLDELARGLTPYCRWAKKLDISNSVPDYNSPAYDELGKELNKTYGQLYISAVKALTRLEKVIFPLTTTGPCPDIIRAMADLPNLKKAKFVVYGDLPVSRGDRFPFDLLTQLTALQVRYIPYKIPDIRQKIRALLSRTTALQSLRIDIDHGEPEDGQCDLAAFLPDDGTAISVTSLTVAQTPLTLSAACVRPLRNLTHLSVQEDYKRPKLHLPFWTAMKNENLHLQSLDVEPLTPGMLSYIKSYSSLRRLVVNWPGDGQGPEGYEKLLDELYTVIPKHKDTLRVFFHGPKTPGPGPWCLNEERLQCLLECTNLLRLDLVLFRPRQCESKSTRFHVFPTDTLLSTVIQGFPLLQALKLIYVQTPLTWGEQLEELAPGSHFIRSGQFTARRNEIGEIIAQEIASPVFPVTSTPTGGRVQLGLRVKAWDRVLSLRRVEVDGQPEDGVEKCAFVYDGLAQGLWSGW